MSQLKVISVRVTELIQTDNEKGAEAYLRSLAFTDPVGQVQAVKRQMVRGRRLALLKRARAKRQRIQAQPEKD